MKQNRKKAFTLSELLLTLAIIGVVAAITIPQLVIGMQKKQAGSQLGRVVSQVELGCQNLIQYENSKITDGSYINNLSDVPDLSIKKLAPFIGAQDTDETVQTSNIKKYSSVPGTFLMQAAYADPASGDTINITPTEDPNEVVLRMLIDVNGSNNKPNAYGKDIFEFGLTNSCKMVPYGLATYETDCANGNISDGRACSARVVADGWKVKY